MWLASCAPAGQLFTQATQDFKLIGMDLIKNKGEQSILSFFPTPWLCQDLLAAPLSSIWISGRFKRESFPWQVCVGSRIGPVKYTQRDKKKTVFLIMNARIFLFHDF